MQTEKEIIEWIQGLQATYNTLNRYADSERLTVSWCNLEYTKKFIYEQLVTKVRELNDFRNRNVDNGPLLSTIMGEARLPQH